MLSENIKILRKQKGLSQETLAQQINVVRQTVSKWEKGLSVPDAEMLNTLSELFEVPVSTLLGSTIEEKEKTPDSGMEEIAKQLAVLNEQLANQAVRRRKNWKRVIFGILIAIALFIAVWAVCFWLFRYQREKNAVLSTTEIECSLNGETYCYEVTYDQNYMIYYAGGDAWIANHVHTENYSDANMLLAQIEDYFTDCGGTYTVTADAVPYTENQTD